MTTLLPPIAPRFLLLVLALLVRPAAARAADEPPASPIESLRKRLADDPKGDDARALADDIRKYVGPVARGPKVDGLDVTWTVKVDDGSTPVLVGDGNFRLPFIRVGETDLYVASTRFRDGQAISWAIQYDKAPGKESPLLPNSSKTEVYNQPPELRRDPSLPRGTLEAKPAWKSKIFDGTTRDWWVYVPAQYKPESPASVMVFQDGAGYKEFVPTVFDHLIAKGEMPVTVAIFLNPGTFEGGRSNRSFEYDTLSDQYARFLLEEILPEVEKTVKLRHDAASRAIAGISSGGICAFTVAWERPDEFSKVLSWVGSFTNIASGKTTREGGHNYEALIRKTRPVKPIRVFLQDGARDLDNANGNWPLANQQMAKSLEFSKYDYKFVFGEGFHSNNHGRAILPDSLRWLWRDAPK